MIESAPTNRERNCADTVGTVTVRGLAISNAKNKFIF